MTALSGGYDGEVACRGSRPPKSGFEPGYISAPRMDIGGFSEQDAADGLTWEGAQRQHLYDAKWGLHGDMPPGIGNELISPDYYKTHPIQQDRGDLYTSFRLTELPEHQRTAYMAKRVKLLADKEAHDARWWDQYPEHDYRRVLHTTTTIAPYFPPRDASLLAPMAEPLPVSEVVGGAAEPMFTMRNRNVDDADRRGIFVMNRRVYPGSHYVSK